MKYIFRIFVIFIVEPILFLVVMAPIYYGCIAIAWLIHLIWYLRRPSKEWFEYWIWSHEESGVGKEYYNETNGCWYSWHAYYRTPLDAIRRRKIYRRYRVKKYDE